MGDESSGVVSLLLDSGETKDDLNLPTFVKIGEPTENDKKVTDEILKAQEEGKDIFVIVLDAIGQEKIIGTKITDPSEVIFLLLCCPGTLGMLWACGHA